MKKHKDFVSHVLYHKLTANLRWVNWLNLGELIDYTGRNKTKQSQARVGQNLFRKAGLST